MVRNLQNEIEYAAKPVYKFIVTKTKIYGIQIPNTFFRLHKNSVSERSSQPQSVYHSREWTKKT